MNSGKLRVNFLALWTVLLAAKLALAASLPLFVDEAFYAWEARFPAWAYSDLPGLSAFLAGMGQQLAPGEAWLLRLPFLVLGSAVPWLAVSCARRWFGPAAGWQAGLLCLLMPLSGLLGVLALPDVPLVFAAMLSLEAISRLRQRVALGGLAALALALLVGGLTHYRFALVLAAGLAGLLLDARGRELLRVPGLWLVLLIGAAAWIPLLQWNLEHAGAGMRFQLLDRNPWAFHADGIAWLPIQFLLVTPALFVLLVSTLARAWRQRDADAVAPWRLLLGIASVSVVAYFLLGFFVDDERVSFHWPLSGWLALATAAPVVLAGWSRRARRAVHGLAAAGLLGALAFLVAASVPQLRSDLAASRVYPADFSGWDALASELLAHPGVEGAVIVAGDFEVGAQLAFRLDRRDILVLDSPLNHKHGRAAQLQAWGLQYSGAAGAPLPRLLVIDDAATALKHRLAGYHRLCSQFGRLRAPEILSVDHGRKRYLLYQLDARTDRSAGCITPAIAWIDTPEGGARVPGRFELSGWAFKDGAGIRRVEVTLDGRHIADARYGNEMPNVAQYWKISTDPNHPRVGFTASIDAGGVAPGKHWLGLVLHGADGSREVWSEQAVVIDR